MLLEEEFDIVVSSPAVKNVLEKRDVKIFDVLFMRIQALKV